MRITTKGRYGLRAVIHLAKEKTNTPVSIRFIAQQEDLSPEFLEQIFFKLKNAGIINSTRGAGGGFNLSRKAEEITVLEILDAVGEDVNLSPCEGDGVSGCDRADICTTTCLWTEGTRLMRDFFTKKTLSDVLCECV